ncbi:hypothetical protein INR49_012035 [Caranx melampygus]|nr:hypothetical protein INR49_012035 [Caranx melampygus]
MSVSFQEKIIKINNKKRKKNWTLIFRLQPTHKTQHPPPPNINTIKLSVCGAGGKFVFKMKGLILLCLTGLLYAASTKPSQAQIDAQIKMRELPGVNTPMNNSQGFANATASVSVWNGTVEAIKNEAGFGPPPDDEKDSE